MRAYVLLYVLVATFLNYCIPFQSHTARLFQLMAENKSGKTSMESRSGWSRLSRNVFSNSDFDVETKKGEAVLYSDLKSSVKEIIKEWDYADDAVHINTLQGGITNRLYTLTPNEEEDKTVIVRVYGEGTALFVDRAVENVVFSTLSERGIGPKFYGTFHNGRVEGFCDAKTLKPDEMSNRDMYPKTATAIAQLHVQLIAEINQCAMLWVKLESFFDLAEQAIASSEKKTNDEDDVSLDDMRKESKWLRESLEAFQKSCEGPTEVSTSRREKMRSEGAKFGFEIVLCHNDLLAGNILLSNEVAASSSSSPLSRTPVQYSVEEKTGGSWSSDEECEKGQRQWSDQRQRQEQQQQRGSSKVSEAAGKGEERDFSTSKHKSADGADDTAGIILIDFEYAANNYRAWDIANHFNEFAGFDFDIKKDFPSEERRADFLRHYVRGVYRQGSEACKAALGEVVENDEDMQHFVEGLEVSCLPLSLLIFVPSRHHSCLFSPLLLHVPSSIHPSIQHRKDNSDYRILIIALSPLPSS